MIPNLTMPKMAQKDVFKSFLVEDAHYAGSEEIPCIVTSNLLPEKVIPFSKATRNKDYDCWVHFYEHDVAFECLWNNPRKYLPILKKYKGIISPDYSLYYDMPMCMQVWNTYRGRALSHWLHKNGVEIIPNVRWGDERTFDLACLGVEANKTISVGSHGCIKTIYEKNKFILGFDHVINNLQPQTVIVYGGMPDKIFGLAKMQGIRLIHFESEFGLVHTKEVG